jgi:hypothetical protein
VDGKRFVVLRDVDAECVVILSPFLSEMREVIVAAGEILQVVSTHGDLVSCRPINYDALEAALVAEGTRAHEGYKGYGLVLDRADFDRDCAAASEEARPETP